MTLTKLSTEELSVLEREYAAPVSGDIYRLFAHISAMESEHRALVADNAALMKALDTVVWRGTATITGEEAHDAALNVCDSAHPGAALLSEMEALRKRVAELEDKVTATNVQAAKDRDRAEKAERAERDRDDLHAQLSEWEEKHNDRARERDEARAQAATARAAALEEAATQIEDMWIGCHRMAEECGRDGAKAIRALATTPPPPVVPVAKVREVLRLFRDHKTLGDRWTCNEVASRLGINLDGEQ